MENFVAIIGTLWTLLQMGYELIVTVATGFIEAMPKELVFAFLIIVGVLTHYMSRKFKVQVYIIRLKHRIYKVECSNIRLQRRLTKVEQELTDLKDEPLNEGEPHSQIDQ